MIAKIYKWHRRLSIIIALPVLLWASTGVMHPLMTNIRPAVATQGWPVTAVDSGRIKVTAAEALSRHHLDSIASIRLVHIDTNWFYQVMPAAHAGAKGVIPIYFSCTNGNPLPAGDWLYAQYLARHFLEGREEKAASMSMPMDSEANPMHDCCGAAADCVLHPAHGAAVRNVSMLSDYTPEYKAINRLLPVYQVSFERPDGIRIYVETTHDRYSFAMDNRRIVFDRIFQLFHTWGWLDILGKGKLVVEALFAITALAVAIMGIILFFVTRPGKSGTTTLVRRRSWHRYTAIVASLFTLLWTGSGAYHALTKLHTDDRDRFFVDDHFAANTLSPIQGRLQQAMGGPVSNWSVIKMNGKLYWQVYGVPGHAAAHKDLMKDGKASLPLVKYVLCDDYTVLPGGDSLYARAMASQFSGLSADAVTLVKPVTTFGDEYNFTDKRLPVWEVAYRAPGRPRYFVETSSGKLASMVDDRAMAEGWSFSVFHKHHFMDWGGKPVRDGSTIFWALMQVIMIGIGLLLYFTRRTRKK